MIFDFDADTILSGIESAMDEADARLSQEAMDHIVNQINASLPGLVELMTYNTEETWKDIAGGAAGWGSKYAKAIKSNFKGSEGTVFLDETSIDPSSGKPNLMFAKMMEGGVKTWSIKEALLASDKAKTGPSGIKYIVVPLPVATPRKAGSGHKASYFGGREMTQEIHDLVKAGEKVSEGTTITVKTTAGSKQVDVSGLTRYNTRQRHSQYGIFRCVSSNSKGWQYPDVPPEPIFPSVIQYVEKRMAEVLKQFCADIVETYSK